MDPVTPVTNEPGLDDLRHGFPRFSFMAWGNKAPAACSATVICGHPVILAPGLRSIATGTAIDLQVESAVGPDSPNTA